VGRRCGMGDDAMNAGAVMNPPGTLNPDQARGLQTLLNGLTSDQALWLSGYLAALAAPPAWGNGSGGGSAVLAEGSGKGGSGAPRLDGDGAPRRLTILYGTETGNAEAVAGLLARSATEAGISARAVDMAEYRTRDLREEAFLALVAATHGEGDPPDPAVGFFEFLLSRKAPRLEGARFAVLALGDSSYVEFCKAGHDLDRRLEELGGERILDRVDCDVDYEEDAGAWVEGLVEALVSQGVPAGAGSIGPGVANVPGRATLPAAERSLARPSWSRRNPYPAELLDAIPLTGLRSDKETLHVELRVDPGALPFEPGDSLGVIPRNEDDVVQCVLDALQAAPGARVRIGDGEKVLAQALREELELTLVTPRFLAAWAETAAAAELGALLEPERKQDLHRFLRCHQVWDVLERYPVPGLDPQAFVEMVRRLQPRLYSIASSPRWVPDQIDLTVAVARRTPDGKPRNGVASSWLADRREPGDTIPVFVERNPGFRLPEDPAVPLVMVGAGTGVAPYRAFLQDREESGATGRSWLFFGERRFREDFVYQTEWQRLLRDGLLTRMDVAFSRDQPEKIYVQHRLRERGREVWEWLEEGAHLYVCGDADGMAPAVQEALEDIIREEGGRSPEAAREYLTTLRAHRRYQRDIY
jgi:sulfite reductase (NADPH) flavoprotein alpha-component